MHCSSQHQNHHFQRPLHLQVSAAVLVVNCIGVPLQSIAFTASGFAVYCIIGYIVGSVNCTGSLVSGGISLAWL